ncbi:MAG: hypothetical protein PVI43_00795 [Candidatus Bathyarchaeota archaeon]|jgi:hypothetical protein
MNNRKTLRKILLVILFPAWLLLLIAAILSDLMVLAMHDEWDGQAEKLIRDLKEALFRS